ncbi:hypothetical protein BDN70DRAFT_863521 [Pholiota conissans]|uniref:Fungal-type protein kinase domain-containing protein n=1 Tax=Pholiota conissans TaxID=109636 RepID=A0A9P5YYH0_9AGAR|nr:hypothetical protein BDN70DRAFT_863521 [Pholiota conissans]
MQSLRPDLNERLAREMKGHFVGSMDPDPFLNQFLPLDPAIEPVHISRKIKSHFRKTANSAEGEMYNKFVKTMKPYIPGLVFYDTHASPDTERDGLKPDCGVYLANDLPAANKRTDFSKLTTFVEFKGIENYDPFTDPEDLDNMPPDFSFENNGKQNTKNRGQIGAYSAAISGSQFRVHVFSVSVCGPTARFIRWDRTGAVVTRRFNYTTEPHLLVGFFRRYSQASLSERGYDLSVIPATDEEVAMMDDATKEKMKADNKHHREFRKMLVPDRTDPGLEKPVLVSFPPRYSCRSPFSRSTRPMLAFDLTEKELHFLKDFWRADVDGIDKEGDIYQLLKSKGVSNIAPFGMGNDVRNHATVADVWASKDLPWLTPTNRLVPLRHYRMTLRVVYRRLNDFKSSHEFISAIADAMEAHDEAFFKAKILHRDISVGNIMIGPNGKGVLLDWDLCLNRAKNPQPPRRPSRTGTWQFMSIALLEKRSAYHDIEDDRESAFWLILWIALRFTNNVIPEDARNNFSKLMKAFDEVFVHDDGTTSGGSAKSTFLLRYESQKIGFTDRKELETLLEELAAVLGVRYHNRPPQTSFVTLQEIEDNLKLNPQSQLMQKVRDDSPAYIYKNRAEKLKEKGWFVKTIRMYLDKGQWPLDPPVPQPVLTSKTDVPNSIGTSKRKLDEIEQTLDADERVLKSARLFTESYASRSQSRANNSHS